MNAIVLRNDSIHFFNRTYTQAPCTRPSLLWRACYTYIFIYIGLSLKYKKYTPKKFYILNISQNRSLLSLVNIKLLNLLNNNLLLQESTIPTATLHLHIDK